MGAARMSLESMLYPVSLIAETAGSAPLADGFWYSGDDIAVATRFPMSSTATRAVGRFSPDGPEGYRAETAPDAPLRGTRAAARADERAHRETNSAARTERLRRASRDEKRIARAERYAARRDAETQYDLGSTVRVVAS